MQDNIINAHRLIGEIIHDPGEERRGKIVGVDQARSTPVIFVIWQERAGIQRFELTRDELRQLADACCRPRPTAQDRRGRGSDDAPVSSDDGVSASSAFAQRRVGYR
ncbi:MULTISPECIES: hypothetical protein [Salinicola]|uniref:Uncharacterized protein n=1 Tax=Salinicola socius TaxID=404433 RepID=A0A1Q8SN17_9GAMM|nr:MULTISPECIES: hypothetical protein [Salinicola]OLO02792.1 hypothetical protein BTW07_17985 [Salinicola socius]